MGSGRRSTNPVPKGIFRDSMANNPALYVAVRGCKGVHHPCITLIIILRRNMYFSAIQTTRLLHWPLVPSELRAHAALCDSYYSSQPAACYPLHFRPLAAPKALRALLSRRTISFRAPANILSYTGHAMKISHRISKNHASGAAQSLLFTYMHIRSVSRCTSPLEA